MKEEGRKIILFSEPQEYIYSAHIDLREGEHILVRSGSSLTDILNQPHLTNVRKTKYNILPGYILLRDVKIFSVRQKVFREFSYCTVKTENITFAYDADSSQYEGNEDLRKASRSRTLGYVYETFYFRDFFSIAGQRVNLPHEPNKSFVGVMNPQLKGAFLGYPIEKYDRVVETLPRDYCVVNKDHRSFRMLKS